MSQPAVKRACDGCHRRKVKCDGTNPCRNCQTSSLSCTYNAIPQKKGPKGSRAKVISELRESQRLTSLSARVQQKLHTGSQQPPPPNPALNPTPGMLTGKLVRTCLEYFFNNMYAQMPILDQAQVEQQIGQMEQNRDIYCMLASLCAFVVLQPGLDMTAILEGEDQQLLLQSGVSIASSNLLVEETIRVRKGYDHVEPVTYNGLVTNFFLLCCSFAMEDHDKAWFHLREATTMICMGNMTSEDHLQGYSAGDAARRRRLFWLFYCHERAYAIQRHRPVTLSASIKGPNSSDDPNELFYNQLEYFVNLANIYRPMDDAFMATWKKARVHVSPQNVAQLQRSLDEYMRQFFTDSQQIESAKRDGQEWIKNLAWDFVNGNGDGSVAYHANREFVARMAAQFPNNGTPPVTSEFIENLLQMSSNLIDFLTVATPANVRYRFSTSDYLRQIICLISVIRGGSNQLLPLLFFKVNEVLPRLIDPMVDHAPQPHDPVAQMMMMQNMDMFDGFGTAGMAQVPQMQTTMDSNSYDNNYDQKFTPEEYDQRFPEVNGSPEGSINSSQPSFTSNIPQGNEMNNTFIGSPAMSYPGQNMNTFACSPMPDIMSPMSNPGQPDPMSQQASRQQLPSSSMMNPGMIPQEVNSMMFNMHQGLQQQNNFQSMGNMGGYQQLQRSNTDPSNSIAMGMDYQYR